MYNRLARMDLECRYEILHPDNILVSNHRSMMQCNSVAVEMAWRLGCEHTWTFVGACMCV